MLHILCCHFQSVSTSAVGMRRPSFYEDGCGVSVRWPVVRHRQRTSVVDGVAWLQRGIWYGEPPDTPVSPSRLFPFSRLGIESVVFLPFWLSDHYQTFHCSGRASTNYADDCSIPGVCFGPHRLHRLRPHRGRCWHHQSQRSMVTFLCGRHATVHQLPSRQHQRHEIKLPTCAADVVQWCASHRLWMNSDKTEILYGLHFTHTWRNWLLTTAPFRSCQRSFNLHTLFVFLACCLTLN